jgi:hypothetical protein
MAATHAVLDHPAVAEKVGTNMRPKAIATSSQRGPTERRVF